MKMKLNPLNPIRANEGKCGKIVAGRLRATPALNSLDNLLLVLQIETGTQEIETEKNRATASILSSTNFAMADIWYTTGHGFCVESCRTG